MNLLSIGLTVTHLVLGGENIGFSINPPGLLISGTYDININGRSYNPINNDIREGDIILSADNKKVEDISDLNDVIKDSNDSNIDLVIERDGKNINRELCIYKDKDKIKTGLYVKEETLGIGTITYYLKSNSSFGALGHPCKENESIVPLTNGKIYKSNVNGISKSSNNKVGQKIATLEKDKVLGEVNKNTYCGISGLVYDIPNNPSYEIATEEEIKVGEAKIYTVINGGKKEAFNILITNVKPKEDTKGIAFKITDEKLLSKTGGIVAGMSGSPIVQNNKIIGAVTHAITSNPTKGYGIFITSMLNGLVS